MRRQKGVTLTGFIIVAVIVVLALLLGLKIGPPYLEYFAIQKQFKTIASDSSVRTMSRRDIEGAFVARATIENIKSIAPGDIQINKDGNDVIISADYSVKVPLFGNLNACMDFAPTSAAK